MKILGPFLFVLGLACLGLSQLLLSVATQKLERAKCYAVHGVACVKHIRGGQA